MAIRLYLSALTLVFLIAASLGRGVNALEAIVVTCALVYLILDAREYLQLAKAKLVVLEQLEDIAKLISRETGKPATEATSKISEDGA